MKQKKNDKKKYKLIKQGETVMRPLACYSYLRTDECEVCYWQVQGLSPRTHCRMRLISSIFVTGCTPTRMDSAVAVFAYSLKLPKLLFVLIRGRLSCNETVALCVCSTLYAVLRELSVRGISLGSVEIKFKQQCEILK